MADTKISDLTDGATANSTDRIPVARAGANKYVTPGYLATFLGFVGGILAATAGGAGAISGALKANGAGVVSQAAAADLSNGTTGSGAVALATAATLTTPIVGSYTFATLPSAAANSGATARVTDIGPATAGSLWISNGTIWKPVNGRVVIIPQCTRVFVAGGGTETPSGLKFQFPAAFFNPGDKLVFYYSASKAGTATTGTFTFRMGTAGTTGDTILANWNIQAAASRSTGGIAEFTIASTTSVQQEGVGLSANGIPGSYAANNAVAYATAVTISNVSNSLWVALNITPGATDTFAVENGRMEYFSA